MFTSIKPPVEYNTTEEEYLDNQVSNDGLLSGQELEDGDRVFGTISSNFDRDWYFVDLPPGEQNLELTIEAFYHASPADLKISLFPPETFDDPSTNPVRVRNNGSPLSSYDPYLLVILDYGCKWGVLIVSLTVTGSDYTVCSRCTEYSE